MTPASEVPSRRTEMKRTPRAAGAWVWLVLLLLAMACEETREAEEPGPAEVNQPRMTHSFDRLGVQGASQLVELDLHAPNLLLAQGGLRVCWSREPESSCVDLHGYGTWPFWANLEPLKRAFRVRCPESLAPQAWQGLVPPIAAQGSVRPDVTSSRAERVLGPAVDSGCSQVELEVLRGDTRMSGLPRAGGVGLAHCPEGFEEVDTQVGAFAERTCSRSSDRISIGHTEGLIEWLTVDQASVTRPVATGVGGWREGRPGEVPSIGWGAPRLKSHTTWAFEWVGSPDDRWLASVQSYEGVVREGPMLQLWPEGGLALIGGYVDDEPDGLWVWVDYSGQAAFARVFEMGAIVAEPPVRTVISDERPWP
jgi:hypothetical protein